MWLRGKGSSAWILSLAVLLLGACANLLAVGGPKVPVLALPDRPKIEATMPVDREGNMMPGITLYSLEEEQGEVNVTVIWSRGAHAAFGEWLREVLARGRANYCALRALNDQSDVACQAGPVEPQDGKPTPFFEREGLYPVGSP